MKAEHYPMKYSAVYILLFSINLILSIRVFITVNPFINNDMCLAWYILAFRGAARQSKYGTSLFVGQLVYLHHTFFFPHPCTGVIVICLWWLQNCNPERSRDSELNISLTPRLHTEVKSFSLWLKNWWVEDNHSFQQFFTADRQTHCHHFDTLTSALDTLYY